MWHMISDQCAVCSLHLGVMNVHGGDTICGT